MQKYTVLVKCKRTKQQDGSYATLEGYWMRHIQASNEEEARRKAAATLDARLEPVIEESRVL